MGGFFKKFFKRKPVPLMSKNDALGSYTGNSTIDESPTQDADDL